MCGWCPGNRQLCAVDFAQLEQRLRLGQTTHMLNSHVSHLLDEWWIIEKDSSKNKNKEREKSKNHNNHPNPNWQGSIVLLTTEDNEMEPAAALHWSALLTMVNHGDGILDYDATLSLNTAFNCHGKIRPFKIRSTSILPSHSDLMIVID
ncbi:hypothetical protein TNCV_2980011 [Trichonephila clavipes]|nr:hypothetical protein TNCV_2980011 [Trichonephila clavipes]